MLLLPFDRTNQTQFTEVPNPAWAYACGKDGRSGDDGMVTPLMLIQLLARMRLGDLSSSTGGWNGG